MVQHQRVTIADVAARSGVAISSVSAALNGRPGVSEATRERIVKTAQAMGFVPSAQARSLSENRAFAVALVVHRATEVLEQDPFFAAFIAGVERSLDPRGYALVLQIGATDDGMLDRYRRLSASRRIDGVFLNELVVDDPRVDLVRELSLPAVAIGPDPDSPLPSIRQACEPGITDAIAHLAQLGHRSVALIGGPEGFVHSRQRELAWRAACAQLGVATGPVANGGFTYEGGASAARQLMSSPHDRPSAVLCVNDLSALGFMAEAQQMGLSIPRDVSVIGYDGLRLGSLVRPALTTVCTSPAEVGFEAAELLLAVIEGRYEGDVEVAPARLEIRGSTEAVSR